MTYPNDPTRYNNMILSEVTSGEYVEWLSDIASEATSKVVDEDSKVGEIAWPGRMSNIGLMHTGLITDPSLIPMTKSIADLDDLQVYLDKYVRDNKLTKRRGVKTGGKKWRTNTAPDALKLARSFDVLSNDELGLPVNYNSDNYGRSYRMSLRFLDKPFGFTLKDSSIDETPGFVKPIDELYIALLQGRLDDI